MDIAAGLSAASHAMATLKAMRELDKAYDQVTLKGQIVDLMDQVLDVRIALQDAQETLDAKNKEISDLRSNKDHRESTLMVGGFRYDRKIDEDSTPSGSPYCLRCDTVDSVLIHTIWDTGGLKCPQCKTGYRDAACFDW